MRLHEVEEENWPMYLIPLLTGKALVAYNEIDEREPHKNIKQAMLVRFEINCELNV